MFEERIEQLRRQFRRLRVLDTGCRAFGALTHRYSLGAPAGEEAVLAFERNAAITLPADYRAFLLQYSSGGAGPGYGLNSFPFRTDDLATPFPHTQAWNPYPTSDGGLSEQDYFSPTHATGTLLLDHEGCGHLTLLVVSGPERGHVWGDSRISDGGIYPCCAYDGPAAKPDPRYTPLYDSHEDRRMTFLDWYEHWVNRTIEFLEMPRQT